MSKKFSISNGMLNGISKNIEKANTIEAKNNFRVEYIDIKDIKRNEKNFYEIVDVEELAEDIKINGLNHNLVVRKLDNGTYELISGERRFTALNKLVNDGDELFALVPCKVIEANDIDTEIILIQANAQTRELSESEKLKQVERLSELYKTKKANGEKIPGKIRDLIANDLKLSPTQVGRYERINNKLIPELKSLLEEGNLTTANASEFSTLTQENQKVILEIIKDKIKLSKEEALNLKNKLKEVENAREIELKEKQSLINHYSNENIKLKEKLNIETSKSNEEIKQLEGQLRVEIEKKINDDYLLKIEEIKNEAKANFEEKEKLKKEISELKNNAPKENLEELKENHAILSDLRNVFSTLVSISKRHTKMIDSKIPISADIKTELERAITATSILSKLKNEIS